MSIKDVIKNSFLESFGGTYSTTGIPTMIIALAVAFIFGLLICLVYNKFYRGVVYNRSFAVTLVGMCVMTAMVTLAISTKVVISLGMVGALSIVRYRTAVKEPLDLLYLFWAITTGIACGAQMYVLAVIAGVIMTLVLIIFNCRPRSGLMYIVVVRITGAAGAKERHIPTRNSRKQIADFQTACTPVNTKTNKISGSLRQGGKLINTTQILCHARESCKDRSG